MNNNIKRNYLYIVFFALFYSLNAQSQNLTPILPEPLSVNYKQGVFKIDSELEIYSPNLNLQFEIADFIKTIEKNTLPNSTQFKITQSKPLKKQYIQLKTLSESSRKKVSKEYYQLNIESEKITIEAKEPSGFYYGLNTLSQLLLSNVKGEIPCLEIQDEPQFTWRGMHLDVCRHFFTVEEIKKYLDLLASYKMNTFHWHLTEDQGWRIEIKKYPLLTSKGAFRNGTMIGPYKDQKFDSLRYGGFYSQDEIKEVVNYAIQRHITIIPEIEMPGHALAALCAYPQFSCNKKPLEVAKSWGVFEDVYCAGNDSTFQFLSDILDEIINLFPGKYIHIGGDECPKTRWNECSSCQNRIKQENLKDEHELQSYFIKRIEKYVNKKGKSIIGWDEILEGGLAPNAAVMSWRGEAGGIEAANQNHSVVMSPGKPCYFDHYQSAKIENEPLAIGGLNTLEDVYNYNPVPKNIQKGKENFILGAQANVWTEYILNYSQVEYMAVPRMIALSEVLWCNPNKKNYKNFIQRLQIHSKILDRKKINYCPIFKEIE